MHLNLQLSIDRNSKNSNRICAVHTNLLFTRDNGAALQRKHVHERDRLL